MFSYLYPLLALERVLPCLGQTHFAFSERLISLQLRKLTLGLPVRSHPLLTLETVVVLCCLSPACSVFVNLENILSALLACRSASYGSVARSPGCPVLEVDVGTRRTASLPGTPKRAWSHGFMLIERSTLQFYSSANGPVHKSQSHWLLALCNRRAIDGAT